jgi:hypothetical protein
MAKDIGQESKYGQAAAHKGYEIAFARAAEHFGAKHGQVFWQGSTKVGSR